MDVTVGGGEKEREAIERAREEREGRSVGGSVCSEDGLEKKAERWKESRERAVRCGTRDVK